MDVFESFETRRSIRSFSPDPVSSESIARMKDAVRVAPSACNRQPYRWLFVTDAEALAKIRAACPQRALRSATLVVVGLVDRAAAYDTGDGRHIADFDMGIAAEHLVLAAAAEGLGSCYIAAYDRRPIERLFCGGGWTSEIMVAVGHPAEGPSPFVRKDANALFEDI